MSFLELLSLHGVKILVLLTLTGILVRHRASRCWSFVAYLLAIVTCNGLVSFWPSGLLFDRSFFITTQGIFDVLKLLVALELVLQAVRAFPGAAASARRFALLILASTLAAILTGPGNVSYPVFFEWQPKIVAGTIWLFTMTALMALWYHLPIHRWHRAILMGFAPYLFVFQTLLGLLHNFGYSFVRRLSALDGVAYLVLTAWWSFSAWRPAEVVEVAPEVLHVLGLEEA